MAQRHIFIVYTNPVAGRDDEYNDWYDNRHLPDVLKIPGVVGARRFRLSDQQRMDPPFPWQYAAIYEIESDNLDEVITPLREWIGTEQMPRSDAMSPDRECYFFQPISERTRPEAR